VGTRPRLPFYLDHAEVAGADLSPAGDRPK